ncbi:MAG: TPM domain-containing protein, partial [Phormidesmis sp.]
MEKAVCSCALVAIASHSILHQLPYIPPSPAKRREIGKEGVDNGVLFLVSKGDRRTEVETGYGVEGVLSDAKVGSILASRVTPQFKSGNFDAGILAGTEAIVSSLKGEAFEGASSSRGQRVVNNSIAVESADGVVTTGLQVIFGMTSVVCLAILSLR